MRNYYNESDSVEDEGICQNCGEFTYDCECEDEAVSEDEEELI